MRVRRQPRHPIPQRRILRERKCGAARAGAGRPRCAAAVIGEPLLKDTAMLSALDAAAKKEGDAVVAKQFVLSLAAGRDGRDEKNSREVIDSPISRNNEPAHRPRDLHPGPPLPQNFIEPF